MRICMAAVYDIRNPRSWSGTPYSLYKAMSAIDENEITTIRLSDYHTQRNLKQNMLRNTDIKESLHAHGRVSKLGMSDQNPLNSALLQKHCRKEDFDALLEFGGFLPGKNLPPYYIYSDSSHDLALDYYAKYGYLPFGHAAKSVEDIRKAADFAKQIYRNAQGVFCMSQWMADSMIQTTGVPADRVHVVYAGANWHDADVTFPEKPHSIDGKKEIHLLLVGVSYEGKGVDLAQKALEILNRGSDKEYYLHVCGIRTPFEHDAHVLNHGFTSKPDLVKLLTACDVFVLPSRFDCFGISFVEAMQFGLPCVGRNICAMPEIIEKGVSGELISAQDDAQELADCIDRICRDPARYEQYSIHALQNSKRFSWSNVAADMMRVLQK